MTLKHIYAFKIVVNHIGPLDAAFAEARGEARKLFARYQGFTDALLVFKQATQKLELDPISNDVDHEPIQWEFELGVTEDKK